MTTSTPNDFAYLCIWAFDYECRPNQQRVVAIHPTGFLLAGDSQPDYISYFYSHFLQKVRFDVNNGGDVTTNLSKKRRWRHFGDTVSYERSQLIIDRKGSEFLRKTTFLPWGTDTKTPQAQRLDSSTGKQNKKSYAFRLRTKHGRRRNKYKIVLVRTGGERFLEVGKMLF